MLNLIQKSNWFTGLLILFMPVTLIFFLASQMAYSQVQGRFEANLAIPEITDMAGLAAIASDEIIILRGQISPATPRPAVEGPAADLIIFQERPAAGRDARFREEFPLIFPPLVLDLPDGSVSITPSDSDEIIIQGERHTVPAGDRVLTGFRIWDTISVQGTWQPQPTPALIEATGVTSADRAQFIAEWQAAFQKIAWARNGLGLLTLISILVLVVQLRRAKQTPLPQNDGELCPPQTPKTIPTA